MHQNEHDLRQTYDSIHFSLSVSFKADNMEWHALTNEPCCEKDSGYPHDGRANKNPYLHDRRADKDSYPHDSNNQCIILRLQYPS